MPVTHCVCEGKSFRQLLDWARSHGVETLRELSVGTGCASHCRLCAPYLEYALATGEAEVPYPCPALPLGKSKADPK